jgi:hypothetical protein
MPRYSNGRLPAPGTPGSPLYVIATGWDSNGYWEFQITAGTHAKWLAAKAFAEKHYGRTLHIRSGWNVYRPYPIQVDARIRACNQGNCAGAAKAGNSSHGGSWYDPRARYTRDCLAIDVDPNGLSWAQVWQACRSAGFEVGLITGAIAGMEEPWHIIDFDPWRAVPSGGGAIPLPIPKPEPAPEPEEEDEEDEMKFTVHYNTVTSEYALGCAGIGADLEEFTVPVGDGQKRVEGKVEVYRGFMTTYDWATGVAWARTYAKGIGGETSRTSTKDYVQIQLELTRVATELATSASK